MSEERRGCGREVCSFDVMGFSPYTIRDSPYILSSWATADWGRGGGFFFFGATGDMQKEFDPASLVGGRHVAYMLHHTRGP